MANSRRWFARRGCGSTQCSPVAGQSLSALAHSGKGAIVHTLRSFPPFPPTLIPVPPPRTRLSTSFPSDAVDERHQRAGEVRRGHCSLAQRRGVIAPPPPSLTSSSSSFACNHRTTLRPAALLFSRSETAWHTGRSDPYREDDDRGPAASETKEAATTLRRPGPPSPARPPLSSESTFKLLESNKHGSAGGARSRREASALTFASSAFSPPHRPVGLARLKVALARFLCCLLLRLNRIAPPNFFRNRRPLANVRGRPCTAASLRRRKRCGVGSSSQAHKQL